MTSEQKKRVSSKILESIPEESKVEVEARELTQPKSDTSVASAGPKWQVEGTKAKETSFVNDFFFSHPDKVLGI